MTDIQTDRQTAIYDSRVAFAAEKLKMTYRLLKTKNVFLCKIEVVSYIFAVKTTVTK